MKTFYTIIVLATLSYLAASTVADERTLTPEQLEQLAKDGELNQVAARPSKLPDLTKGDLVGGTTKSNRINTWNLGPTGAIGMFVAGFSGDQIQVQTVLKGSPAEGKLQYGDVIVGVGGKKFVAGEHMGYVLGKAIIEAEKAENQGVLTLHVWRDRNFAARNGKKDVVDTDIERLISDAQKDDSLYEWKPEARNEFEKSVAKTIQGLSTRRLLHQRRSQATRLAVVQ